MNYYVYAHINAVTYEVFYIGKGKNKRAYNKSCRNIHWKNIVNKYGYFITFLADGLNEENALAIEHQYIERFGLKVNGGLLVNVETYIKRPSITSRNVEAFKKLCSDSKKGALNPNFGKKTWSYNKPLPDITKKRLSEAHTGKTLSPEHKQKVTAALVTVAKQVQIDNAYQVQCLVSGKVWKNRWACCEDLNIPIHTFRNWVFRNTVIKGNHLQYIKK